MSNSIGGNLEISAIMDASGIQTGADRGGQAMQSLSASAERMAANLAGVGSETVTMTSSLSNAAKMVELLSAKMLASGSAARTRGGQRSSMIGGMSEAGNEQAFQQSITDRFNQVAESRDAEERLRRARRRDIDVQDRAADEAAQTAADARMRAAAESRDAEERLRRARRRDIDVQDRAANEAAQTAAAARMRAAADQDRDERLNARMTGAQNANTRNPLQPMEDAILRMRAELNPMVGMQARLAQEALEFRQHMNAAIIAGDLTLDNAIALTAQFQQQQALLAQHAAHQQQGFLGMRRMGFAAQQFGYAIEDAASVWGTMGMSGAFRAAGNNLTAMGALMGPQVGVLASLSAAAVSLGISFYEAKQKAAELVSENKELKELTESITTRMEYRISIESQLRDARNASHEELMSQYQQNLEKVQEIDAAEKARLGTINQLIDLTAKNNELKEIERQISEDNALWWQKQFNWSLTAWEYVRDAGEGVFHLFESEEAAKLAEEKFNAEARIAIEMAHQQALLDKANSAEQKRLELINAQAAALNDRTRTLFGEMANGDIAGRNMRQGKFDVANARTMRTKMGGFGFEDRVGTIATGDDQALAAASRQLLADRQAMVQAAQNENRTAENRLQILQEIKGIETEILRVDQMRVELQEAGKRSMESANNSITGRFESFNEELRIENEILRTRKKMNEELDIALRSRHLDQQQAQALSLEMERAFEIEKERRDNEKEIVELKKRESQLQANARQDLAPGTALGGLQRGSDEARAFLENERLRGMAATDAEPVVAELRRVRDEIKRLREANDRAGNSRPRNAAIF